LPAQTAFEVAPSLAAFEVLQLGTDGREGNGTGARSLQFGHVADTTFGPDGTVYSSDGDGGSANRVVGVSVPQQGFTSRPPLWRFDWATTPKLPATRYNNPHSLTYHAPSGLLVVCDRDNNATRLLRAADGADMGTLDCGLDFGGTAGKPFGVRSLQLGSHDLLFLALMDNPQDGAHQEIVVLNASSLSAAAGGVGRIQRCDVIQRITVDPSELSGPHLLGVDPATGDLYAALVADSPRSTVLRYTLA